MIKRLWSGEHSRRLVMLRAFLEAAEVDPAVSTGPLTSLSEAWSALERAEKSDPRTVAGLLDHPQVGSWLSYTLRRHRGGARSPAPSYQDFGQLHAVAIVASAATGQAYRAVLPLRHGRVMLPQLGMAYFEDCADWDTAEAGTEDGRVWLRHGDQTIEVPSAPVDADGWWPLRRITVGDEVRLTVWVDDLDPMRDLADPVRPHRLSPTEFQRWANLLADAWTILVDDHRPMAEALAVGVTSLVPLPVGDGWDTRSASTGDAFGAIMCSPPPDAVTLAVSLAHEFMHIKLGGLMHLFTMTQGAGQPCLYAPWRDDPRPAGGLLQGIYAFFEITAFWRRQRARSGRLGDFEYAYARAMTREALDIALRDGNLSERGRRFAEALGDEMNGWADDEIDPEAAALARLVGDGHRAGWRIRHGRAPEEGVAALVAAWGSDTPPVIDIGPSEILPDPGMRHWSAGRLGLARRRILAPDRQAEALREDWGATLTDADVALFAGDAATAAQGFLAEIAADPESADAWTGLGLALCADSKEPVAAGLALTGRPEVVLAVYRAGAGGRSPLEVAGWVGERLALQPC